eukprot:3306901-Pyramimonas_sp.AAC.1
MLAADPPETHGAVPRGPGDRTAGAAGRPCAARQQLGRQPPALDQAKEWAPEAFAPQPRTCLRCKYLQNKQQDGGRAAGD